MCRTQAMSCGCRELYKWIERRHGHGRPGSDPRLDTMVAVVDTDASKHGSRVGCVVGEVCGNGGYVIGGGDGCSAEVVSENDGVRGDDGFEREAGN
ncbi:proline-rich receptor-like protein kinase PERK2 [Iris pallida]|uniref:Proline-rich receptor-like protein kinase PERK2 n=1 Tax=Iris pallida TaxID=29817 RepID=A0AAX6E4J1_IRIPA|nr:proline-rich receptor-like protein kinase PERK2 [Iris pallida]